MKTSNRLTELADFIKSKRPEQFDLRIISEHAECGTIACVMGWAGILWGPGLVYNTGITYDEASHLCYPAGYVNPTRHAALCRLRALARKYAARGK